MLMRVTLLNVAMPLLAAKLLEVAEVRRRRWP